MPTGEPIARVSRANGGMIQRDMRKAQRARDVLREIPMDELMARVGAAGELYIERDAADGRRHADARRVRAGAVGHHRAARAHVPREHEEERVRARRDAQHPDVADARPRLRRAVRAATAKNAACRSATRRRARSSAWCCRPTRRACTRSGCRSSRCRSASCSSPDRRSRGRRTGWPKPSFRPAFRARRSPSIRDWATSARRCSTAAAAA